MNRLLDMLQERRPGYHPMTSILDITFDCPADDYRLKLDCHKTLLKYVEAERRSVELKNDDGSDLVKLVINIDGNDEDNENEE